MSKLERQNAKAKELGKFVYLHSRDGVVLYVGSGNYRRPYHFHRDKGLWPVVFSPTNPPDVTIVARGLTLADSLKLEQELMDFHRPLLNSHNTINEFNLRYRQYNKERVQP